MEKKMTRAKRIMQLLFGSVVVLTIGIGAFWIGKTFRSKETVPQINSATSDFRLQDLINQRRPEHWDFWETQLALTAPPRAQPVRTIPEWNPASAVVLALDDEYTTSFALNKLLSTTNKRDLLANSNAAKKYLTEQVCGTLTGQYDRSPTQTELDKLKADYQSLCLTSALIESKTAAANFGDPKDKLLVAEWLKDDVLVRELTMAHTFLKLISELSQYTKVLILVRTPNPAESISVNEDALQTNIDLIKEFPSGSDLLNSANVEFLQLPLSTKWVRDYGPIFVEGADKQIVIVDPRYNPERKSLRDKRQDEQFREIAKQFSQNETANTGDETAAEPASEESGRLYDDVSPSFLAVYLRQQNGVGLSANPINEVRPPIELDGGDFATDGSGIGFTSTQTLLENGGNLELLAQVFREYFGLSDVVYLLPLPGSTVKHLDMFFKVVSSDTILLGTFEDTQPPDDKVRALQAEAQRVLNYDLEILRNFYESRGVKINVVKNDEGELKQPQANERIVNVVLVPMPNVERPVRQSAERIQKSYTEILPLLEKLVTKYQKLKDAGRNPDNYRPTPAETDAINRYNKLSIEKQSLDVRYPQGLDIFRTYLNALQLNTPKGNVVLIPSYSKYDSLENRVQSIFRKVYTRAYRDVSIVRIESDNLIELQGSIHCLTQTIPSTVSVFPDEWNYRSKVGKN